MLVEVSTASSHRDEQEQIKDIVAIQVCGKWESIYAFSQYIESDSTVARFSPSYKCNGWAMVDWA